jgi:uncharacterized membrane protein YphA (DoxX/SURF4 family)
LILLGVLLMVGLGTPIVGALGALVAIWEMVSHPLSRPQLVEIAVTAVALTLLGPGAWSLDAWLYGWRQIKIPSRTETAQDSRDSP